MTLSAVESSSSDADWISLAIACASVKAVASLQMRVVSTRMLPWLTVTSASSAVGKRTSSAARKAAASNDSIVPETTKTVLTTVA